MGNNTYHKISFKDVNFAIQHTSSGSFIIINTLPINQQQCLIKNTLSCESEEATINQLLISRLEILLNPVEQVHLLLSPLYLQKKLIIINYLE